MKFAVLATGPSMSQAVADSVRGSCKVVAVSDAHQLAPWADAMASTDAAWWRAHPEALQFAGQRFTAAPDLHDLHGLQRVEGAVSGSNSGLLACQVAVLLGATQILLCGFDMGGLHYFGAHPAPLKNTTPQRYQVFKSQFARFRPPGVDIVNCTPGSALNCFRRARLEDML